MTAKPAQWRRLRHLADKLDVQVANGRITDPSLSTRHPRGVLVMTAGATTSELREWYQLVYKVGLVARDLDPGSLELPDAASAGHLSSERVTVLLTTIVRGDRLCEGLLVRHLRSGLVQSLCRRAAELNLPGDDGTLPI